MRENDATATVKRGERERGVFRCQNCSSGERNSGRAGDFFLDVVRRSEFHERSVTDENWGDDGLNASRKRTSVARGSACHSLQSKQLFVLK